ncbi:alkaline ceramidase 1-like [Protobothrops mucrosquamatus]|uniref:alkaline ceramidase 1-like n=1 Tax=Protobothrops mucrosquamatus TaxID=103944 RepID=UPI000775CE26|nr:alkaline ceramidase 1-like [Protobothrops mucrosquamatus]
MLQIFSYLSSEVDWCEANFERSEYIAEYYNSISNVAFFILSPLLLWLNTDYIAYRALPIRGFVILQVFIGIFSFYYHMTLSYAGQLLDELSILWTLCISYGFWLPVRYFPSFIKNRHVFINMALLYYVSLILFFDVYNDLPSSEPSMEYWPSSSFPLALPYIVIRKPVKWC